MVNRLHPRLRPDNAERLKVYRALLYFRQSIIARWLGSGNAVFPCQRFHVPEADSVGITVKSEKARYFNLQHCKRLWLCPVCASWHAKTRRKQMERAISGMANQGYAMAFVTYTVQHHKGDPLALVRNRVLDAHKTMHSGKAWQRIERDYDWAGSIKTVEVTHNENGWHFHLHELGFIADDAQIENLESTLSDRWARSVDTAGGFATRSNGLHCTRADIVARDYVAKWGIVPELASGHDKKSRANGVLPFQLPDMVLSDGKRAGWCKATFAEFAGAVHGIKQFWASPSVRPFMAEPPQTHAEGDTLHGELLRVTLDQWRTIWSHGLRVAALRAAEDGTLQSLLDKLDKVG